MAQSPKEEPSKNIKSIIAELEGDHSLKHVETAEKNVLPSAEQIDQERTQRKLIEGIETFPKQQLKPAQTEEKNTLPDLTQIEQEKTLVSSS